MKGNNISLEEINNLFFLKFSQFYKENNRKPTKVLISKGYWDFISENIGRCIDSNTGKNMFRGLDVYRLVDENVFEVC